MIHQKYVGQNILVSFFVKWSNLKLKYKNYCAAYKSVVQCVEQRQEIS